MAASIDVARARADTPGCDRVLHFNNAGSSLMPRAVLDAQVEHLRLEAAIGGYEAAARAKPAVTRCYDAIAEMLNCGRDEVALVENATVAWDMAFHAFDFQPGDRILTAEAEYASNYIAFLKVAKSHGVEVVVVPSDATGALSVPDLERMIDARSKLIAVTHVPTNGGLVNPAAEIGRVARAAGVPFLLDACQSAGQLPLDVEDLGCDLLSATGRKHLRGPRGSGFLYVRKRLLDRLEPPFLDLHAATWVARDRYEMRPDARRFENWEFNYAAVIGLGVAVDYAMDWGLPAIAARIGELAESLRAGLAGIPGCRVRDIGSQRCGLVTFTLEGLEPAGIETRLRQQAINISISTRRSTWIDMERRGLEAMARASVHYFNTQDEVARFCEAVDGLRAS